MDKEHTCDGCGDTFGNGYTITTEEGYRFCDNCISENTWQIDCPDTGDTYYYLLDTEI